DQAARPQSAPLGDRPCRRAPAPPPQLPAGLGPPGSPRGARACSCLRHDGPAGFRAARRGARPGRRGGWRTVGRRLVPAGWEGASVSAQELENYESDLELQLFREYRDVVSLFTYVVETERRFYLANQVDLQVRSGGGEVF